MSMVGFAHIVLLGTREGTSGRVFGQYQFTLSAGGNSWVRTFDREERLLEFLRSDIAVTPAAAESALEELRRSGNTTIANIEFRESEAPAMGLEQLPSDY